jgi:hypothetical protein
MWSWLQDNHGAISAIASVLTLAIWTLYFQLLLSSYHHRRRPKILISLVAGHRPSAHCLVTNMSAEPIYVEAIFTEIGKRGPGEPRRIERRSLSDLDIRTVKDGDRRPQWFQGPLNSGEMIDIGSFGDLVKMTSDGGDFDGDMNEIILTVAATYTAEDTLVAARRVFDIGRRDGELLLRPRSPSAEQVRSRSARRKIEDALREEMQSGQA